MKAASSRPFPKIGQQNLGSALYRRILLKNSAAFGGRSYHDIVAFELYRLVIFIGLSRRIGEQYPLFSSGLKWVEIIVLHVDWRFFTAATLCTFVCLLPHEGRAQERAFAPTESPNDIVTSAINRSSAANLGTGLKQARTDVVEFLAGPFPYDGRAPGSGKPFIVTDE